MQAYITTTIIGVFGVSSDMEIISYKPFPKDAVQIAEKLKLSESQVIAEESQAKDELTKKGYKEIIFGVRKSGVSNTEPNNPTEQFIKGNLRKLALEYKFVRDQSEFNQLLTRVNIELTKVKIKKAIERDNLIIHANGAVNELDKSINIFVERLREFYSMHFPEMDRMVESNEKFVRIVEKFGRRESIDEPELRQLSGKSMGADFKDEDIKMLQTFAAEINHLYKLRETTSKYLEKLLNEVSPNFSELATPMLAAKLISKAGGLERLSKMASSTVQLLGAEKALFRFLHSKGKASSPRFGLIYNHPLIQNCPEKHRGKIARVLAAKLSLAAKIDYYSKEYKADKLKEDLQHKVTQILNSK